MQVNKFFSPMLSYHLSCIAVCQCDDSTVNFYSCRCVHSSTIATLYRGLCGYRDITCNHHMMACWIASFVFLESRTNANVCCS